MEFGAWELTKLSELLNPKNDDSDEDEQKVKSKSNLRPSDLVKPTIVKEVEDEKKEKCEPEENEDAVPEFSDWRKCPVWDMIYKQHLAPSDVYLQMGGKTPLTSSCEEMFFTIEMPGENGKNIDIKLTKQQLNLTSPNYRLSLPLPHPIDTTKGDAKWDSDTQKLKLTLVMDREFDYINF